VVNTWAHGVAAQAQHHGKHRLAGSAPWLEEVVHHDRQAGRYPESPAGKEQKRRWPRWAGTMAIRSQAMVTGSIRSPTRKSWKKRMTSCPLLEDQAWGRAYVCLKEPPRDHSGKANLVIGVSGRVSRRLPARSPCSWGKDEDQVGQADGKGSALPKPLIDRA